MYSVYDWMIITGGGVCSMTGGFGIELGLIDHSRASGSEKLQFWSL